jgi:hypothetical protein
VRRDEIDIVATNLNQIHPAIKFTYEVEDNSQLPFLDTLLVRENDTISIDIFRKPTDNPLCIPSNSNHPHSHKLAAFESNIFRMWNLPLTDERREKEFNYIKIMAHINGYTTDVVEKINEKHKRRNELRSLTTLKPLDKKKKVRERENKNGRKFAHFAIIPFCNPLSYKIEKVLKKYDINVCYANRGKLKNILPRGKRKIADIESSGIYEIACGKCEETYRGQTKRRLDVRDKEHTSHVKMRQADKSSVAKHCIENGHARGPMKLLERVNEPHKLDAYESLYIAKADKLMNTGEAPIVSKLFTYAKDITRK